MIIFAGALYGLLAALAAGVQFALASGAPWGHLTLGGAFQGRLPRAVRAGALVQSALLLSMGATMAGAAGVIAWVPPGWAIWATLAVTVFTTITNTLAPSAPERRLWGPVTATMLICALVITFMPQGS